MAYQFRGEIKLILEEVYQLVNLSVIIDVTLKGINLCKSNKGRVTKKE